MTEKKKKAKASEGGDSKIVGVSRGFRKFVRGEKARARREILDLAARAARIRELNEMLRAAAKSESDPEARARREKKKAKRKGSEVKC